MRLEEYGQYEEPELTIQEKNDRSAKQSVGKDFYRYANQVEPIFNIKFGPEDNSGQRHVHIDDLIMDTVKAYDSGEKLVMFLWLMIDGTKQRFHLLYHDAGTVGYARMANGFAVSGMLSNLHYDWGDKKAQKLIPILWLIGSAKGNSFSGELWYTSNKEKLAKRQEERKVQTK